MHGSVFNANLHSSLWCCLCYWEISKQLLRQGRGWLLGQQGIPQRVCCWPHISSLVSSEKTPREVGGIYNCTNSLKRAPNGQLENSWQFPEPKSFIHFQSIISRVAEKVSGTMLIKSGTISVQNIHCVNWNNSACKGKGGTPQQVSLASNCLLHDRVSGFFCHHHRSTAPWIMRPKQPKCFWSPEG